MSKKLCLEGKKIGHLTFIRETKERDSRYVVWECVCDCGNKTRISTKRINQKKILSCGCRSCSEKKIRMSKAENLIGKRYGRLVVQSRTENRNGRVCWLCRCDCGNTHTATSSILKSGKCKSCGCLRQERSRFIIDLRGKRYGRLKVLYPIDKRSSKGSVMWHCICDCGNEIDISEEHIVSGRNVSCGCKKREIQEKIGSTLTFVDGTCIEWLKSRKSRKDNTSGFRGVYRTSEGRYRTEIGFKRKRFYLGTYKSYSDAVEIRKNAERFIHGGYIDLFERWSAENERESIHTGNDVQRDSALYFEVSRPETGVLRITTGKDDRYLYYGEKTGYMNNREF